MATIAPSCEKRRAVAAPMPEPAPVTMTTLPAKRRDGSEGLAELDCEDGDAMGRSFRGVCVESKRPFFARPASAFVRLRRRMPVGGHPAGACRQPASGPGSAPVQGKGRQALQRRTMRSMMCSSAAAASVQRPVCTGEVWMMALRRAVSQWKRAR